MMECNHLHPLQKRNQKEKPQDDEETKFKPNSRNTTRYRFTMKIRIRGSIRQGDVLSVIEYAALDELLKELRKKGLGLKMNKNTQTLTLSYGWMMYA